MQNMQWTLVNAHTYNHTIESVIIITYTLMVKHVASHHWAKYEISWCRIAEA